MLGALYLVLGALYLVLCTLYLVLCTLYLVSTKHKAQSTKHQVQSTKHYGASMMSSRPNWKLGFLRPFMYFAAVCESDVIRIGSAIVASQGT